MNARFRPSQKTECLISSTKTQLFLQFLTIFRSEQSVSTIFQPYIIPNRTYERITKNWRYPPFKDVALFPGTAHLFCRFACWDTEERLRRTAWEVRVVAGDIDKEGFGDESNLWPPFCRICNRQRISIRSIQRPKIMQVMQEKKYLLHAGVSPPRLMQLHVGTSRIEKAVAP